MTELEQNNFMAEMMRYASAADTPEHIMNNLLEYICLMFDADRTCIFEENPDGTYDNTYEYCKFDVMSAMDRLKHISGNDFFYEWNESFKMLQSVVVEDIECYRESNPLLYELLLGKEVTKLVVCPIEVNSVLAGFFCIDNPPIEIMQEISEIVLVISFIFDMMLRIRNYSKAIDESSKKDALTDCKNRKALEWAYDGKFAKDTSICVLMCDLNGLKAKNDLEGHKAGDKYICDAAKLLWEFFGKENTYRLGGDEFVVVCLGNTYDEINKKIDEFTCKSERVGVSMSFGVEYKSQIDQEFEYILKAADEKMYEAKNMYYEKTGKSRRLL